MTTLKLDTKTPALDGTLNVFDELTQLSVGELFEEVVRLAAEITPSQCSLLLLIARRADKSHPDAARAGVVALHIRRLIAA